MGSFCDVKLLMPEMLYPKPYSPKGPCTQQSGLGFRDFGTTQCSTGVWEVYDYLVLGPLGIGFPQPYRVKGKEQLQTSGRGPRNHRSGGTEEGFRVQGLEFNV